MPQRKGSGRRSTFIRRSRKADAAEKAVIHNLKGAGRSRVIRPFFQLNDQDVENIVEVVDERLRANMITPDMERAIVRALNERLRGRF